VLRPEFVERKLQLITEDLGRLTGFRDVRYEELLEDDIRLAALERILERIVLRAIDVNEHLLSTHATGEEAKTTRLTYRETFERLSELGVYPEAFSKEIALSAGLRNILVHEYNDVDRRIVHAAIGTTLEQYTAYVEAVREFVDRSSSDPG
jgi:uncharacterized protein YutE (UPF0331/DUF86 family)